VDGLIWARIGKTDEWRWKALEDGARAALASLPGEKAEGRVFPWKNRWAVYRPWRPIEKATASNSPRTWPGTPSGPGSPGGRQPEDPHGHHGPRRPEIERPL
jgi:hypothetical protein